MALTSQQGKELVHELTMEYVKQVGLLNCRPDEIEEKIAKIADISKVIYNAVDKNYHDFKWL